MGDASGDIPRHWGTTVSSSQTGSPSSRETPFYDLGTFSAGREGAPLLSTRTERCPSGNLRLLLGAGPGRCRTPPPSRATPRARSQAPGPGLCLCSGGPNAAPLQQPSAVRWTGAERRRLSPGPARSRCGRASRDRRDSTVPSSDLRHPVLENTGSQSSDARWGKMLRSPDPNDELDRPLDLEDRTDLLAPRFLLECV